MKTNRSLPSEIVILGVCLPILGQLSSQAQPANNMFGNRITIVGTNVVVTGSSIGATREAGEPYHAGNGGGASVWWSWTAPRNETATISTSGSSFDTLLAVYTGSSVSTLTKVASNDDDPDAYDYTSKVVFNATANTTYQIAVDGYDGDAGSIKLSVVLAALPPPPPAPAWALPDPYGSKIYSSNFLGKVIILDFWATWCGPCKSEIPDYVFLQNKYRADGLVIIGPSVDTTSLVVREFMATNSPQLNYQIVMADYALQSAYGGVSAIPTTFIIDRQNLVRQKFVGTQSRSTFEQAIVPLLYSNMQLGCQRVGNQMVLRWPTCAQTFRLETSATPNGSWSAWPASPIVVNGTNTVQAPATNSARFFRLRML